MTTFQERINAEIATFQKEMDEYGLVVSHSHGGHFANDENTMFCATLETKPIMKKGQKGIIDVLKTKKYRINEYCRKDKDGNKYFVFKVCKNVLVRCGESEAL